MKWLNKMAQISWHTFLDLLTMLTTPHMFLKKLSFSETALIRQLQLRNEKALSQLYDLYSPALFSLIKRIVKCQLTAEEMLQNVFLKIWLNIERYSSEKGSLYTWMLSIARNEAIDYLRSKEVKKKGLTFLLTETELKKATGTERRMVRYDIVKSFSCLQQKERIIIELSNTGFTCKEIGLMLCIPEGSVKTKMRATYKKLRVMLA